jgi:hypothetical protein
MFASNTFVAMQEEQDLGPIGALRKRWDDLSNALNCYGTVENAKHYARETCGPHLTAARSCAPGMFQ